MILRYYFNYCNGFLSDLDETVSEHEDFSLKEEAGQYPPRHSAKQLDPPVLHGRNLLSGCSKFTKFDLFAHIFKRYNQQFKICMYVNFVLSFYRHQMLKESTLLYKVKCELIVTRSSQISQYNGRLLIHKA